MSFATNNHNSQIDLIPEENISPREMISGHSLSIDTGIAFHCGINAALVYNHICYWLRMNMKTAHAMKEGKVWMYETQEKMAEFFHFLSEKEVKNAIKILVDKGLLVKKNFNLNSFDHTNWYSLSDSVYQKVLTIVPKGPIDSAPPGPSEGPRQDLLYIKEEEKEKRNNKAAAASEDIFFKGRNNSLESISQSQVFSHFSKKKYPTIVIEQAIEKFKKRKGEVGDPIKILELMVKDILKKGSISEDYTPKPIRESQVYEKINNPVRLDMEKLMKKGK